MSFFEWLRDGSDAHVVRPLSRGFRIVPSDADSEEVREQFHQIVEEARENATAGGYELTLLHRSSVDPKRRWDSAVVTVPWLDRVLDSWETRTSADEIDDEEARGIRYAQPFIPAE
jgi:hypothetical protein